MASYLYIEPVVTTKSGITGVLFIILLTVAIMQYLHIYLNWNSKAIKCKVENMYIAYITGNISPWFRTCVQSK